MCSKNIKNKEHIGFWVSRYCKSDQSDSSIIQDVGRMNGYNVPKHVRVFCNLRPCISISNGTRTEKEYRYRRGYEMCASRGTTRGRDDLAMEHTDRTRAQTDVKLRHRVFETVEDAVNFINEYFNDVWQVRNEEKNDRTAARMSIEQILENKYQISSSRDRWKRIQKAACGNYVVYWDENHEDAPKNDTESTG